jgi:opacity protein-like surface antigen
MKRRLFALLALVTLASPTICLATPPRPGPYVSGFAGVAIPYNTTATSNNSGINDRINFDPGVNIGGTGGYDFGFLRVEGELSYKHGEIRSVDARATNISYGDVDGRIGALAMMGNIFLDLRNPGPITPYFGGGLGFAALHQSDTYGTDFSAPRGNRPLIYPSDDDAVFAYQVGGGLEIALSRMLSLDLSYRYFRTSEATFSSGDNLYENKLRFESHNAAAGIRVKF